MFRGKRNLNLFAHSSARIYQKGNLGGRLATLTKGRSKSRAHKTNLHRIDRLRESSVLLGLRTRAAERRSFLKGYTSHF